jgi:hypothetical protein
MMRSSLVVVLAVLAAACKQPEAPAVRAAAPPAAVPPAGPAAAPIQGKVLERTDADVYSYLRLSTANGEVWAAVPRTDVAVGTEVKVVNWNDVPGFEGKTLKRKFDHIYFGVLEGPAAPAGAPAPGGSPHVTPPPPESPTLAEMTARHAAAAAGPSEAGSVKVEKAKGADARTVAEVYGQKGKLKGKTVAVRGKVVKFSPGIMGKNWVHLRDGTGGQGSNDLTVTTGDHVAVGDVVVARGKVTTDRDFGSGYAYPVMLEEAKVAK